MAKTKKNGEKTAKINPDIGKVTQFSKENQPTPEKKKAGWEKRRALKDLANVVVVGQGKEVAKEIFDSIGLVVISEEYTLEIIMTAKQIQKAINTGDTSAYNAAMDRLSGKVQNKVDVTSGGEKIEGGAGLTMKDVFEAKRIRLEREQKENKH